MYGFIVITVAVDTCVLHDKFMNNVNKIEFGNNWNWIAFINKCSHIVLWQSILLATVALHCIIGNHCMTWIHSSTGSQLLTGQGLRTSNESQARPNHLQHRPLSVSCTFHTGVGWVWLSLIPRLFPSPVWEWGYGRQAKEEPKQF